MPLCVQGEPTCFTRSLQCRNDSDPILLEPLTELEARGDHIYKIRYDYPNVPPYVNCFGLEPLYQHLRYNNTDPYTNEPLSRTQVQIIQGAHRRRTGQALQPADFKSLEEKQVVLQAHGTDWWNDGGDDDGREEEEPEYDTSHHDDAENRVQQIYERDRQEYDPVHLLQTLHRARDVCTNCTALESKGLDFNFTLLIDSVKNLIDALVERMPTLCHVNEIYPFQEFLRSELLRLAHDFDALRRRSRDTMHYNNMLGVIIELAYSVPKGYPPFTADMIAMPETYDRYARARVVLERFCQRRDRSASPVRSQRQSPPRNRSRSPRRERSRSPPRRSARRLARR